MQLRDEPRAALLAAGTRVRYRPGTWLYVPGDPPGPAMVLRSGVVDVVDCSGSGRIVRSVHPGELFGEEPALDGLCRGTGAIARDDVEVAAIDPMWFELLLTEVDGLAVDLLRDLSSRIRHVTACTRSRDGGFHAPSLG